MAYSCLFCYHDEMKRKDIFMMVSNCFLAIPIVFSFIYGEWLYLFFAVGALIFSYLYHWFKIRDRETILFPLFRFFDWSFAAAAFFYMFYFSYHFLSGSLQLFIYLSLIGVIFFFLYGWQYSDYKKLHPYFHIVAGFISGLILIFSRLS